MSTAHVHDPEKCRQYLDSLSDYVDGELGEALCRELEAHIAECENCRVVVNTLSKTVVLYRQLPVPEMPNAVKERLYKVLNLNDLQRSLPDRGAESSSTIAPEA